MLFIKKENVIKYYLGNKAEMKGWKSEHLMLLERLLMVELEVANEYFIVKASVLLASIGEVLNKNGDLLDVIRAISTIEIQCKYDVQIH